MKPSSTYLGDGAYASCEERNELVVWAERPCEFSPHSIRMERNWVALEPDALQRLVEFARTELGWKVK